MRMPTALLLLCGDLDRQPQSHHTYLAVIMQAGMWAPPVRVLPPCLQFSLLAAHICRVA